MCIWIATWYLISDILSLCQQTIYCTNYLYERRTIDRHKISQYMYHTWLLSFTYKNDPVTDLVLCSKNKQPITSFGIVDPTTSERSEQLLVLVLQPTVYQSFKSTVITFYHHDEYEFTILFIYRVLTCAGPCWYSSWRHKMVTSESKGRRCRCDGYWITLQRYDRILST